jgi:hypothetical protein
MRGGFYVVPPCLNHVLPTNSCHARKQDYTLFKSGHDGTIVLPEYPGRSYKQFPTREKLPASTAAHDPQEACQFSPDK